MGQAHPVYKIPGQHLGHPALLDESCHPPDISTKLLQGKEFVFKRGCLLGPKATRPLKPSSGAAMAAETDEAEERGKRPRRAPSGPAPGVLDRVLRELPGRGRS